MFTEQEMKEYGLAPNELKHYGILGMKWGVRRYQNKDGSLTAEGRNHYSSDSNPHAIGEMLKSSFRKHSGVKQPNDLSFDGEKAYTDSKKYAEYKKSFHKMQKQAMKQEIRNAKRENRPNLKEVSFYPKMKKNESAESYRSRVAKFQEDYRKAKTAFDKVYDTLFQDWLNKSYNDISQLPNKEQEFARAALYVYLDGRGIR